MGGEILQELHRGLRTHTDACQELEMLPETPTLCFKAGVQKVIGDSRSRSDLPVLHFQVIMKHGAGFFFFYCKLQHNERKHDLSL